MPTATLEEYLESIFRLSQEGPVKPTQIADAVGVSGPTVTATLRSLGHVEVWDPLDGSIATPRSRAGGLYTSLRLTVGGSGALESIENRLADESYPFTSDIFELDTDQGLFSNREARPVSVTTEPTRLGN